MIQGRYTLTSLIIHMILLLGILGMTWTCGRRQHILQVDFNILPGAAKTASSQPGKMQRQGKSPGQAPKRARLKNAAVRKSRTTYTRNLRHVHCSKSTSPPFHRKKHKEAKSSGHVQKAAIKPTRHDRPKKNFLKKTLVASNTPVPSAETRQTGTEKLKNTGSSESKAKSTKPDKLAAKQPCPLATGNSQGTGHIKQGTGHIKRDGQQQYINAQFEYIRERIMRCLRYPHLARIMGWSGQTKIKFIINNDGSVRDIKVVSSSGHAILDRYAMAAVKKVAPFPRPPEEAEIVIPITYRLASNSK